MINTDLKLRFSALLILLIFFDFHFVKSIIEDYYTMLQTVDQDYQKKFLRLAKKDSEPSLVDLDCDSDD